MSAERSTREVRDELSSMVRSHQQAVIRAQLYRNDPYDVFGGFLPAVAVGCGGLWARGVLRATVAR